MKDYTITQEPMGEQYRRMLRFSAALCSQALLVVRHGCGMDERAARVLECLQPSCLCSQERSEWPGTLLLYGHTALVYQYVLNEQSLSILTQSANHLFEWVQPGLPEDLCLLRPNGEPWLVSICHESDAFLRMSDDEYDAFRQQCHEVRLDDTGGAQPIR